MIFTTDSAEATERIGARLARSLDTGGVKSAFIALRGEMGVGKTAFTRGFASELGIRSVKSPTYTVLNEYRGSRPVFHFDMYRINDEDELYSIGFYDYQDRNGICLIEWSENIEYALPDEYFSVKIEKCEENTELRKITTELIK